MSDKPVVIFDGKCGFCRIWIQYWEQLTGTGMEYAASQDVGSTATPRSRPQSYHNPCRW